jgi:hypothetical protein
MRRSGGLEAERSDDGTTEGRGASGTWKAEGMEDGELGRRGDGDAETRRE